MKNEKYKSTDSMGLERGRMRSKVNKDEKKVMKFIDSTEEIMRNLNRSNMGKRARLKLSGQQIDVLESNFKVDSHPSHLTKSFLANKLCIPLKNIQIWFQNRRAKEKMVRDEGTEAVENIRDGGRDYRVNYQSMCPFDFSPQERYFF